MGYYSNVMESTNVVIGIYENNDGTIFEEIIKKVDTNYTEIDLIKDFKKDIEYKNNYKPTLKEYDELMYNIYHNLEKTSGTRITYTSPFIIGTSEGTYTLKCVAQNCFGYSSVDKETYTLIEIGRAHV